MPAFSYPFLTPPCHQCHCLSTLSPLPHWHLGTSCVGSGEDEDKHHEPTSGQLWALSLGIKHLKLQSSSENITNCLSDGLFKEEAYLRLEKMKIHTTCIDFIRGWNPRKICLNNKQKIFLPDITQRIRLHGYRGSFWLSCDNTDAREF